MHRYLISIFFGLLSSGLLLVSCNGKKDDSDAYKNLSTGVSSTQTPPKKMDLEVKDQVTDQQNTASGKKLDTPALPQSERPAEKPSHKQEVKNTAVTSKEEKSEKEEEELNAPASVQASIIPKKIKLKKHKPEVSSLKTPLLSAKTEIAAPSETPAEVETPKPTVRVVEIPFKAITLKDLVGQWKKTNAPAWEPPITISITEVGVVDIRTLRKVPPNLSYCYLHFTNKVDSLVQPDEELKERIKVYYQSINEEQRPLPHWILNLKALKAELLPWGNNSEKCELLVKGTNDRIQRKTDDEEMFWALIMTSEKEFREMWFDSTYEKTNP